MTGKYKIQTENNICHRTDIRKPLNTNLKVNYHKFEPALDSYDSAQDLKVRYYKHDR